MNKREATIVKEFFAAVETQSFRGIQAMVENEPRLLHCQSATGETLLHIAAKCTHVDFTNWLIERGIWLDRQDNEGRTALLIAIDEEPSNKNKHRVIQLLLDAGADPDIQNKYQTSPIALAVMRNDVEAIRALGTAGAKLNARWEKRGYTPLLYALAQKEHTIVSALLESGASATARNERGESPLHLAVEKGDEHTVASTGSLRSQCH